MSDFRGRCTQRRGQAEDLGTYYLEESPADYVRHDRFYGVSFSMWRTWSLEDKPGFVRVRIYYRPLG